LKEEREKQAPLREEISQLRLHNDRLQGELQAQEKKAELIRKAM
jgi:hypothetical protein